MKIVAIVKSESQPGSIAVRTDPPLTEELLKYLRLVAGERSGFTRRDNLLIFKRSSLTKATIDDYNTLLSAAERDLNLDKERAAKEQEAFLDSIADESGIPLE